MRDNSKLYDATYPGASTPFTQNRRVMPLVFVRDGTFDDKHADELEHFATRGSFGIEAPFVYVGNSHRLRTSGAVLLLEALSGAVWVTKESWA